MADLFDLEAITVEDVMTPRAQIEAIDLEAPVADIAGQLASSYHTRLLVYRGEPGNIAGILHLRRVLRPMHAGEFTKEALEAELTEPYFVPAGTPAFAQLQYFQENRQRIALVVDEYGELQGLVTLEDIIEEMIGEFTTTAPVKGFLRPETRESRTAGWPLITASISSGCTFNPPTLITPSRRPWK